MNRLQKTSLLDPTCTAIQKTDDGLKNDFSSHWRNLSMTKNNQTTKKLTIEKLLVVDPNADFAANISDYLILFGYQVSFEIAIDIALRRTQSEQVDLILLADNFSQIHPIDLLRKFKKQNPETLIVILAERGDDQLAVELLKSGAHDYLSRRIKDKNLFTSIATLIKNIQSDSSLEFKKELTSISENQVSGFATKQNISVLDDLQIQSDNSTELKPLSETKPVQIPLSQIKNINLTLEDIPGIHFFLSDDLTIINLTKNCCELFSFFCNEIRGISITTIMPDRFVDDLKQKTDSLLNGNVKQKQPLSFELVISAQTGQALPLKCWLTQQTIKNYDQTIKEGFLLSVEDLSDSKESQAALHFKAVWSEMLQRFSNRFINLRLDDFSTELAKMVSEVAVFYRLDRVSIYLMVAKGTKARIYLEWIKKDQESLKLFSRKIDIDKKLLEMKKMVKGQLQLLSPVGTIENLKADSCLGLSEHYAQVNSQSSAILPLLKGKNTIGWLSLDKSDIERCWSPSDLSMLQPLANLVSEVFRRRSREEHHRITQQKLSENHGRLSEHASLDGLTNLANRRSFNKVIESETRRSAREMTSLSCLFIDVDYFKAYNDTYGHLSGDSCLQTIADVLKNEFKRAGDFVARFGGEEFTVLLPGSSLENATEAAEKLREKIASLNIEHQSSPLEKITISIGVCCLELAKANAAKELILQADKALYRAKNNGRNVVEAVKF